MRSVLLLSVVVAATVYGVVVQEEWKVFKVEHKTQYSSPEELTYDEQEHVANKNNVQHPIVNKIQHINGNKRTASPSMDSLQYFSTDVPTEINWVKKGAVTPVQDQKKRHCAAAGWAFSAAGAIEGQYFVLKGRRIQALSAQELIDCSNFYGNEGCHSGSAAKAFAYVAGRGGIASAKAYPYTAPQGQCRFISAYSNITVSGQYTSYMDEETLQTYVASLGPASVAIYSSLNSFQHYTGGVYYDRNCIYVTPEKLNHEVLVVGYGTEQPGGDYWLIKNSWGQDWGIRGYMKLARNRGNHCGIGSRVSYPLLP